MSNLHLCCPFQVKLAHNPIMTPLVLWDFELQYLEALKLMACLCVTCQVSAIAVNVQFLDFTYFKTVTSLQWSLRPQ